MRIDWSDYSRVHAHRTNLLIHLFAVPLFAVSFILTFVFAERRHFLPATLALAAALAAMVLQAGGHRLETTSPRPFTGPANFLRRWFSEQFFIFPAFLLSGRWWQQFRAAADERLHES